MFLNNAYYSASCVNWLPGCDVDGEPGDDDD